MNILSWNYGGFGNKSKYESLRDLKNMANPSVILLEETKMEASTVLETTKKVFKFNGGIVVSSQGASDDMETLWDEHIWILEVTLETRSWLLTVLKNKDSNNTISVINVYMPNSYKEKTACWNSLSMLKNYIDLSSCIIGGDFNNYLDLREKKGGSKIRDPFSENLSDLISHWDLHDVKPSKGRNTWNKRLSCICQIVAQLDHFLINNNFLLPP
jgi:exonuclease III